MDGDRLYFHPVLLKRYRAENSMVVPVTLLSLICIHLVCHTTGGRRENRRCPAVRTHSSSSMMSYTNTSWISRS